MTVSTTRFFNNNSELFNTLNSELKSLQSQAGSGEAELKLGANVGDISKLSAAEEKKSETNQLLSNSKRVQSDLQILDLAFERMQNLSGLDVFQTVNSGDGNFSVFEVVDDLIESLDGELNSGQTSNLFANASSLTLKLPNGGPEAGISFTMEVDDKIIEINQTVYGNDFTGIANAINSLTAQTGLSASFDGENQLTLSGTAQNLYLNNFEYTGEFSSEPEIQVLDGLNGNHLDTLTVHKLQNTVITGKITDSFEHFASKRAEISASARRAQDAEIFAQDLIITLEEDISEIRDADLASILTQLEFLMTQKEAAQATFTRITSRSLFDLLG